MKSKISKNENLQRIKQIYENTIIKIYDSLFNIQLFLEENNEDKNNIYDNQKILTCKSEINKLANKIEEKFKNELKNNTKKISYKFKYLNIFLKELFKNENSNDDNYYPFYLLSYIMIVINHHEICLTEYFENKLNLNDFKSEDIDKNIISVILRSFIFYEMIFNYYQLKCLKNAKENIFKYFSNIFLNLKIFLDKNIFWNNFLTENEVIEVDNLGKNSFELVKLFLGNDEDENFLGQLINFSILSYKDGYKTLIKEGKLSKEIKVKIIKYINCEFNSQTMIDIIKDINENNKTKIICNSNQNCIKLSLEEVVNEQNKKIVLLMKELKELNLKFIEYKETTDAKIINLEKRINELENNKDK